MEEKDTHSAAQEDSEGAVIKYEIDKETGTLSRLAPRETGVDPALEAAAAGEEIPIVAHRNEGRLLFLEGVVTGMNERIDALEAMVHERLQGLEGLIDKLPNSGGFEREARSLRVALKDRDHYLSLMCTQGHHNACGLDPCACRCHASARVVVQDL